MGFSSEPHFCGTIAEEWTGGASASSPPPSAFSSLRRPRNARPNRVDPPSPLPAPTGRRTPTGLAVVLGMVAASVPMVWLWGFTVDDALITARVAHHLAVGVGHRFNADGAVVDAVTPLGFSFLLAPFAASGPLAALSAAKVLGAAAWVGAAGWLAAELRRFGALALFAGAALLALTIPLAAWAVAGMETALVTALATAALGRSRFAALGAGLAAGLRPELAPWAVVLVASRALFEGRASARSPLAGLAAPLAASVGPLVLVALVRSLVFGQAYPLAALAKPSDAAHGLYYAAGALLFSGPPVLLVARRAYRDASPRTRAIAVAAGAHVVSLVLVGGDWMPLYRLFVPVLPGIVLAGAELLVRSRSRVLVASKLVVAFGVAGLTAVRSGPSAARVGAQRAALIAAARPALAGARSIAALDVGWVGAASAASIVDLAGVTDPGIALLPGGHTTKRLPSGLLESRSVDALVVLAENAALVPLAELEVARGVEARLGALASAEHFQPTAVIPLVGTRRAYVVYRRYADAR